MPLEVFIRFFLTHFVTIFFIVAVYCFADSLFSGRWSQFVYFISNFTNLSFFYITPHLLMYILIDFNLSSFSESSKIRFFCWSFQTKIDSIFLVLLNKKKILLFVIARWWMDFAFRCIEKQIGFLAKLSALTTWLEYRLFFLLNNKFKIHHINIFFKQFFCFYCLITRCNKKNIKPLIVFFNWMKKCVKYSKVKLDLTYLPAFNFFSSPIPAQRSSISRISQYIGTSGGIKDIFESNFRIYLPDHLTLWISTTYIQQGCGLRFSHLCCRIDTCISTNPSLKRHSLLPLTIEPSIFSF